MNPHKSAWREFKDDDVKEQGHRIRYCNKCGSSIQPDGKFCERCGNRIQRKK
ncbi:MAG: hypothetical protein ACFFDC_11320 [Promethearchaeota archaeon]